MKCEICGKEFVKARYSGDYKTLCSSECFMERFWIDKVKAIKLQPNRFPIINGNLYFIDKEHNAESSFRGFGGREFKIRFLIGKQITTTNLWDNGKVPDNHKEQLPDNAIFVI